MTNALKSQILSLAAASRRGRVDGGVLVQKAKNSALGNKSSADCYAPECAAELEVLGADRVRSRMSAVEHPYLVPEDGSGSKADKLSSSA
jgi:hypothetical protein